MVLPVGRCFFEKSESQIAMACIVPKRALKYGALTLKYGTLKYGLKDIAPAFP
jgi:hypothetical protein